MRKLFGFNHLRLAPLPREFAYGPPVQLQAGELLYAAKPRLYAVLQNPRTQAVHAVTYEDTPEGRTALAGQCRVERLLALILGHHVDVETGSRLDFVSSDGHHSDYRHSELL